nr:hypothetical protein [Pseudomonas aeruginosa]
MATSLHRRADVTVKQIRSKRQALIDKLRSPEHLDTVATRDYGTHDPLIAPFPPCACGAPGRLERLPNGKWMASCSDCPKAIPAPQQHDWAACLQWCQLQLDQLDYRALPLFGLEGMDHSQARARLISIYDDLNLRCQVATLDLSLSRRTHAHQAPGLEHYERLCAYRDWAKLALRLVKSAQ